MSKAVDDYILREKLLAVIDILRDEGQSDEVILQKITKKYDSASENIQQLVGELMK